ncbi:LysR substrate-binding domain-containing protein [Variovorax arabinosiphilus]|uniref:LysR substrate-binding domain-containing protein n=1 Tax=Variovorax arabinosiphilus TaxID=3053498 RepID=UPI002577C52E|nr:MULTISPECIES: LysR substrate-binding domain-containing protein [unclassified Variovorax]MDM0120753.1 LysR substrate-binding domain-containing protein [Variovorax sp. J2L1-78]MDM0127335.1 LysR substrate-binding domain-containing protein [Variovorax sp. J2L1-63]MDM0236133.1 LysR substrate-binding domain-containing protein [Variovorax sp. J2R1-6]
MTTPSEVFARGVQLRHLRCLVAVAQERHLARAAERLSLSQPAMSKTLAELEALAGTRLVERGEAGRRGIQRFTVAGEQLLAHALRVLEAIDAGAEALRPDGGERVERLRVGALPSVAPTLLVDALLTLRERMPALQVEVRTGVNAVLFDALRAGELDLVCGRMSDPQRMAGLSFELLCAEPLAMVVRPGHPLVGAASTSVQDAMAHPLVVYSEGTIPRHHTESLLSGLGLRLPATHTQTLDLAVARALVLRSDAVWFTPAGAVRDELLSGALVRLRVPTAGTEEPVGLLLRSGVELSAAQRTLAALLREGASAHAAALAP